MHFEQYFPLGIVRGDAFVGREDEAAWLNRNIQAGVHTLLSAPRRYGKSSLVLYTLEHGHIGFIEIDLQLCRSAKAVEKKIIHGIEQIITQTVKEKDKVLKLAQSFFQKSHKQWKIGLKGFVEVMIEPERYEDIANNILTAFQFLESVLKAEGKKIVFFIDEIQEIHHLVESLEIQGAIRHFAQKTSQIVFIFSGSNRRLLTQMFNNKNMPLYQLCDYMSLNKIPESIYIDYLRKISKKTWNKVISNDVISTILELSGRHPRRTYHLCLYLWRLIDESKKAPVIEDVKKSWEKLIKSELKAVRFFLSKKSTSQLKILTYIALNHHTELTGKDAQRTLNLSSTAISKALQQLEEDDLIEHEDKAYTILDPLLKSVLSQYETELIDP